MRVRRDPPVPASLASRRSVIVGLVVAVLQTGALALASAATASVALRTQTVTAPADVAVGLCLLLGVLRSERAPDVQHPLGYGRERFFWSFIAAAGIFVGGVGAATAETIQAALHPPQTGSYLVGYMVLVTVVALDLVAMVAGQGPLRDRARQRGSTLVRFLWQGTDPAVTTVFLSSAAGLLGGLVALAGLLTRELTGWVAVDVVASALIGLVLLVTSALLLHTSRELLTGRGIAPARLEQMRASVAGLPGVVDVPDLFAIVVGPACLLVDGDVIFDDALDVPAVEAIIAKAGAALRASWPSVVYVYLNPVAGPRERRVVHRPKSSARAPTASVPRSQHP